MGYYEEVEKAKKKALYGSGGTKDNPKGDSYYALMKAKKAVNVDQTKVNLNYLGNNKWSGDSQVKYSTIEDHPASESEIFNIVGQLKSLERIKQTGELESSKHEELPKYGKPSS